MGEEMTSIRLKNGDGVSAPLGDFIAKCMEAFIKIEPAFQAEDKQADLRGILTKVATAYSKSGEEAAQSVFNEYYQSFRSVAEAKKATDEAMAKLAEIKKAGEKEGGNGEAETILAVLAERIGKLNARTSAPVLSAIFQKLNFLPGVGLFDSALKALTNMQHTYSALNSGDDRQVVFEQAAAAIREIDTTLKQNNIHTTPDGVMSRSR